MLNIFTFRKNLCIILLVIFSSAFPKLNAQDAYCVKADFTFTETESGQVAFVGTTDIPVIEWYWYFGDQEVSGAQNPEHVFDYAGDYEVCLKVLADENCTGAVCKKIRVESGALGAACNLFVDFTIDLQGNLMIAKALSLANNNSSYYWDFGDGEKGEGSDIKHEYSTDGTYTICLTVVQPASTPNGEDCIETVCKTITIGSGNPCDLEADFSFNLDGNQFSASASSNAGGNASYEWKLSDGTAYQGEDINHTFLERGEFEICLVVTKFSSTTNEPCSVTVCKKIIVGDAPSDCPLEIDFIFVRSLAGLGAQAKSSDPNAEFFWYISSINFSATGRETSLPLNRPGVYQVCLVVTSAEFQCRKEICKSIIIGRSTGVVSPNPADDIITITSGEQQLTSYSIINSVSGLSQSMKISGYESVIDVTHLPTGLYFLSVEYEDGSTSLQKFYKN